METKISRSAPELELQRAIHCLKYAETSTLQLKNVYSFVLKLNDGLKSAIIGLKATIRSLRRVEQERDYWKMRFETLQKCEDGGNWRLRYESLLERNVQLEEELRKIYTNEMAIEDFHSRVDVNSHFFTRSNGNGNCSNSNVSQSTTNQRRVNAIVDGNDDLDDVEEDESDFEDDSEGAGVGGFLPMIEGSSTNSFVEPAFNPTSLLKIKCEVNEDDDNEPEEEIEIKMQEYETNSNPGERALMIANNLSIMNSDNNNNEVGVQVDYEALRNCLAKDARQCPVCPRICSQRNSTVRHLIEVHHLDRSELMIRKFHKGYHFANFSK